MSDVWDSAASATLPPQTYFGQIFTDAFFVFISKGEPKVPFDPGQHPADKKFTQIKIDGQCERQDGTSYVISREIIAEFGREWAGIVLPSLKVCGVHPRELNEKWASWELVETGRTWVDQMSGETRKATTFKFKEFYPDEAACRAAAAALYSRGRDQGGEQEEDSGLPMPPENSNGNRDGGSTGNNNPEKAVAAQFLPALLAQAGGDVSEFGKLLAGNPLTSKYFDLNSPEVIELIAA